ncbi:MAG: molybdopterin-dependent oxidoreductase [Proteobacteria bacterium]|nr:molybdopterin-dependent oxidoreductase [Pseudomonadota bacterium]
MSAIHPDLILRSREPLNAEPPPGRLRARFITPTEDFYIRSHGAMPAIQAEAFRLKLGGLVTRKLDLTLHDLQARFHHHTLAAVLQCAGNRRGELAAVAPVSGDPWGPGAIGHAEWTGIALRDLLSAAGVPDEAGLHVAFACADEVELPGEGRFTYGVSIPLAKAMAPEVLLAWAMNGSALPPEHGFPLRVVVPGFAGVRSAKWLHAITVQRSASDNAMQQRDYKLLPPDVPAADIDWSRGVTIDEMPLNAVICEPAPDAAVAAGRLMLRGYAMASRRAVTRVDVSVDDGVSWRQATLAERAETPWSWTFWETTVDLPPGEHRLAVRAWDEAGQTQPSSLTDVWNVKGYLNGAWHRLRVVAR